MNAREIRLLQRTTLRIGVRAVGVLVAGALACSLGAGLVPDARYAYAADGSITINQRANSEAAYIMYQVFVADISDGDVATHIAWNASNKSAVIAFLDSDTWLTGASTGYSIWLAGQGRTGSAAHDNAQNAAEYISEMITASSDATAEGGLPAKRSNTFAENLAQHLAEYGKPASPGMAATGIPYANAEGYYLAVADPSSIEVGEAGSAPMWIPLGGSMRTIDAKEDAPTLTFHVMEDRAGSAWGKAADSCMGQDLAFRVQGSLPGNLEAYDRFHDRYVVSLPTGMDLSSNNTSSVAVRLDGTEVTGQVAIEFVGNVLTIDIYDVKALDCERSGGNIEITFAAHLKEGAVTGEEGNMTTANRTYTADPLTLTERSTAQQAVCNYTYEARVVKVDKSNGEHLAGAKFTVRASNGTAYDRGGMPSAQAPNANTDSASAGKYLQADGSLGDAPHEFETGTDGELLVPAMDEGVYIIRETAAPDGYEAQDTDIVLTIASDLDQSEGSITSLSAHMAGGEAASVDGDETSRLLSVSKPSGTVRLQAADDRMLELAGTGLPGNGMLYVAAGVLAGMGTTGLAATGRKRDGRK